MRKPKEKSGRKDSLGSVGWQFFKGEIDFLFLFKRVTVGNKILMTNISIPGS